MNRKFVWGFAVAASAALVATLVLTSDRQAGAAHPEPRAGITAEKVLAGATIPNTLGAVQAYAAAAQAPGTLDGVYCYCDCSKHAGHRSLLTCFESEHGAYCDICMGEAMLAAQLAARGTSLQTIRDAIDRQFGT